MIICVVGPTASHKSTLAEMIREKLNCKLINCDAFQVYKELNKGTAKPSKEEIINNNYFLYDFVSILDGYDVSKYQKNLREILNNSKENYVICGGTGLFLKAGLFDYKFNDEEAMPEDYLASLTNEELYTRLLAIDENDAKKIGINNRKRLLRALYIFEYHKKTKSELNENGKDKILYNDVYFIGINPDREELYENINKRVDLMFENGLKEEAKYLLKNYDNSLRALQAIGYKEFMLDLDDEMTSELIKKNTRNYAKRQITFFKNQFKDINWFSNIDDAFAYFLDIINR